MQARAHALTRSSLFACVTRARAHTNAHTYARAHTRTRARAQTRTRPRTQACISVPDSVTINGTSIDNSAAAAAAKTSAVFGAFDYIFTIVRRRPAPPPRRLKGGEKGEGAERRELARPWRDGEEPTRKE